jgi:VWFA-related protein
MSTHRLGPQRYFAILVALSAGAFAQEPEQGRFQTSVREVVVDVVVHDSHGKLLKKLNSKDLALYEDGVRREIRSWRLVSGQEVRREEAAPAAPAGKVPLPAARTTLSPVQTINLICLVFHDIGPESRAQAYQAAHDFLDSELRPNTIIGVFSLDDRGLHPAARFTTDRAALLQAVQKAATGHSPSLGSSRELFSALGLEQNLAIQPPPLPAQAGASPPNTTIVLNAPDLATVGASLDASSAVGDDASTVALNPLGRDTPHEARVVAIRELHAFNWLVDQLRQMPFRKTVVLFSPGIYRPVDQRDYWKTMIAKANAAGINFYALEVNGVSQASPTLGANAGLRRAGQLSATQKATDGSSLASMAQHSEQDNIADNAIESANTHAALVNLTEDTGGFLVTDSSKRMLTRIMNDAETRYELTYTPAWETYDGRFHKIEVKPVREGLTVEARSGYYAVPVRADGSPISPEDMAGLRALNTTPLPREIDYRAQALHFRSPQGPSQLTLALEIPLANLAATPEPAEKKLRLHASLLILVKDSSGKIVEQIGGDSPMDAPQGEPGSARPGRLTFGRPVTLAPGHYTVQTAVVDWQSGRVGANQFQVDCARQQGPELSTIVLVRRVEDVQGASPGDPLEYQGKRIVPSLASALEAGATPSVFFRVYPDRSNAAKLRLHAQFFIDGSLLADQSSELPPPDASGSVPVMIQVPARPGEHELRLTLYQGSATSAQNIRYSIAAK